MGILDAPGKARRVRRGVISVQNATAVGTLKNAEDCWRVRVNIPIGTGQFRLRVRNWNAGGAANAAGDAAVLTGASFAAVYAGPTARDVNGADTAGYDTAPTQILPGFTLAADGSEYVSAWITDPTKQFTQGRYTLSLAYTGGDTTTGQAHGGGVGWAAITKTGAASHVTDTTTTAFASSSTLPFDVRLEIQSSDAIATGLVIGDSLAGVGYSSFTPHHLRWPELFAARGGHIVTNVGIGSQRFADWADRTKWRFQRAVPANGFDYAITMLGTNDIGLNSVDLPTLKTRALATWAELRALGVSRIYAVTIPPRSFTHSRVAAPAAAAATSITLMHNLGASYSSRIGAVRAGATLTDSKTITSPTGTGPFTYTCSALANAHQPGELVCGGSTSDNEQVRVDFNDWLRGLPAGITGIIPADVIWADPADASTFRSDLVAPDLLHPTNQGMAELAARIPSDLAGLA